MLMDEAGLRYAKLLASRMTTDELFNVLAGASEAVGEGELEDVDVLLAGVTITELMRRDCAITVYEAKVRHSPMTT